MTVETENRLADSIEQTNRRLDELVPLMQAVARTLGIKVEEPDELREAMRALTVDPNPATRRRLREALTPEAVARLGKN